MAADARNMNQNLVVVQMAAGAAPTVAARAAPPDPGSGLDAAVLGVARDNDGVGGRVFANTVETPGRLRGAVERQPDVAED